MTPAQYKAHQLAQKRKKKMISLINRALERYNQNELLEMFIEDCDTDSTIFNEMVSILALKGYAIYKPETMQQGAMLDEYAKTKVFPYYNEQSERVLSLF